MKGQSFLVSTEVLDNAANHQSLAKSVNRIIQKFGLEDHVIAYITHNTGYCSLLQSLECRKEFIFNLSDAFSTKVSTKIFLLQNFEKKP